MTTDAPQNPKLIAARMKLKKRLATAVEDSRKEREANEENLDKADKDIRERFGLLIGAKKK